MITHLSHLLQHGVNAYPNKTAVVHQDGHLTYHELATHANQLAHVLTQQGVQPGDRVGIWLDKSLEMITAVCAILQTGAAYVPLPASAPPKRAAWLLDNCGIKTLVTTNVKGATLPLAAVSALQCLVLTDGTLLAGPRATIPWSAVLSAPTTFRSPTDVTAADRAYILYTSGSTGQPKGVMVSHSAALNFILWARDCFQLQASDRVANHAPLQFDLSTFDIFATLLTGATLVLVPDTLSLFPISVARFIIEQELTVWYSVPSALVRLVLYGQLDQFAFPHLRHVLFAGEVFPLKFLQQLMQLVPQPSYHNLYGPTETNVCTYYPVNEVPTTPLPIGRPCAGHDMIILAAGGHIAPAGGPGELCVSGPSMMQGYWQQPQASQRAFVTVNGETYYRTGDRVRQTSDGNYHLLGRIDQMIKSRGYRIEPGEVESVLYRHPQVAEVAVIPVPDEQFGNLLKAVIVPAQGTCPQRDALSKFCAAQLSPYMLPAHYEFCTSLPKTITGKVDRAALQGEK